MPDPGAVEAYFYWKTTSQDLTDRDPSLEVVAIPVDEDTEALIVQGGYIRIQLTRAKVNDNDLEKAVFGACAGCITVYPGYTSKEMEIPKFNVKTYPVRWSCVYRDEKYYYITASVDAPRLGDDVDFFWGTFG